MHGQDLPVQDLTDCTKGHVPVSSGGKYLPECMQCKLLPGLVMTLYARCLVPIWVTLQHMYHVCG